MCILIHKPAGKSLTRDQIEQCADSNQDGFGVVYRKNTKLKVVKGLIGVNKAKQILSRLHNRECVIHWRWCTHGKVNADNCHPFMVKTVCGERFAMAHNGVFRDIEIRHNDWSDTRQLADWFTGCEADGVRKVLPMIEEWHGTGNRMAFMWADGTVDRTGSWNQIDGIWFSNLNWQRAKYVCTYKPTKQVEHRPYHTSAVYRPWEWSEKVCNKYCHECLYPLTRKEAANGDRCQDCLLKDDGFNMKWSRWDSGKGYDVK